VSYCDLTSYNISNCDVRIHCSVFIASCPLEFSSRRLEHFTKLPLRLSGYTGSNRWQLDSKTKKVTSLSPGQGTLTNKWEPKPKPVSTVSRIINRLLTCVVKGRGGSQSITFLPICWKKWKDSLEVLFFAWRFGRIGEVA